MGTTCTHKPKGQPLTEFFIEHGVLSWGDDSPYTYEVLDSALVNLTEYYAAVEELDLQTGERRVWAAVFKITMVRVPREDPWGHNFCYKDMDESMGPYQTNCPERILKLLTPTEYEHAISWREACWKRINDIKARPKLKPGMKVNLFGHEYVLDVSVGPRGWKVHSIPGNVPYRMNRSQVRKAEVIL